MMDHQNNSTLRTYMAIMAERDAAILERNLAIDERKRALAERDMAMLQRDAAISERNSAIQERNEAISAFQFREMIPPTEVEDQKNILLHHQMVSTSAEPFNMMTTNPAPETDNPRKVRLQLNESKPEKPSKLQRVVIKEESLVDWQAVSTFGDWEDDDGDHLGPDDEEEENEQTDDKHLLDTWDSANVSGMPVPVCSCTGTPQPCYKWGNGGWQSACCTTTISMYPLPQAAHQRYSRVGGRKMSGSAFSKLVSRLTAEGWDLSAPLDLKDHWAKHGTNRYSSVK
ncbi:unnamed protein product [Cuscuta europaea]|uniref:GAGA-binding transcriptional activator n=1 Tax=Cuscuta europaea TaxID=41803 RepID=A0A9P0ZJY8_CUSEU|nr:unnamed protein product [Cuscuta europaea]